MKALLQKLMGGMAFAFGALLVFVGVSVGAANLSLFTAPTGTNPALRPDLIPDLNTLVNAINANAAFAGTVPPSQVIGTIQALFKGTGLQTSTLQLFGPITTTTGGNGTCFAVGAGACFGVYDSNGVLRWLNAN